LSSFVFNGKSPLSLVYGKEPNLSHLKIFDCLCFAAVVKWKYCLELLHDFCLLASGPMMIPLLQKIVFAHKDYEDDKYLEKVSSGFIRTIKVDSKENIADILTIATKLGTPLMLDFYTSDMCMQSWGRSSYARALIELQANVELKDTIMVFGHVLDEGPKTIILEVVKNLKYPIQATRAQVVKRSKLECLDKRGNSKAAGKGSLDVVPGSSSATSIVKNINKLERKILDGKLMFVDDDGKLLYKFDYMGIADSDSEVEEVYNETAGLIASMGLKRGSKSSYGTKSLLEQWRETKRDDDLYESHDMSENL
ncbi:hypothetical protein Tco_0384963, partial [Tanacetum coccineum]